jgi:thioredoxin 1
MAEITLTDQNFTEEVSKEGLLLVDFWAVWCPPCQMLGPIIESIAHEKEEEVRVGKVNVDENPAISGQFQIMSIPTVILFKNGKIFEQTVGLREKTYYLDLIKKAQQ